MRRSVQFTRQPSSSSLGKSLFILLIACLATQHGIGFAVGAEPKESTVVTTVIAPLLLESESASGPPPPASDSRFEISQLEYKGAFRVPSGQFGGDDTRYSVNYAVGALAYHAQNHSLFIAGHAQASRVAEFPIPVPGLQSEVQDLPVSGAPLQNFTTIFPATNDEGINRVTGMMVFDGALIINAEEWYNADGNNTDTTLVVADADQLGGNVDGFFKLTGRANSAGYMGEIPAGLSPLFAGAKYFTGWSSVYSIVSRYSYGPSIWAFDPSDITNGDPATNPNVSATPFMNFGYSSTLREAFDSYDSNAQASPLWNILSDSVVGFFVPDTKTFVALGSTGGIESGIGYKITQTNGNLCGGYCTYDPADNYNYYWLYDVDDVVAAADVSDPRPYAFGQLSLPFDADGQHKIIGGTVDNASGVLYLALANAGQVGTYDRPPLILVYELPKRASVE